MTGWKTWAALEEVTAANMNSYVRDQTVQVFTNSSARSAAITSPTRGLVSFLTDSGALEVYYGATTGWARPWNQPWGNVSEVILGTDSHYAPATWVAPITWNGTGLIANRLYRARTNLYWVASTVGQVDYGIGATNGSPDRPFAIYEFANDAPCQNSQEITFTTTAGSMTRLVTLRKFSGGGTVTLKAWSNLIIEDIGPATSTAPAS